MSDPLANRDPTPGELRIMFSSILDSLRDVKEQMATKEFVNAKFEGSNDRVNRVEADIKEVMKSSASAHIELDKDSKARHAETRSEIAALEIKMDAEVKSLKDQQAEDQKELRQVRSGRINLFIVAALSLVGNLVVLFISTGGFNR
jgi:hypothetical protein